MMGSFSQRVWECALQIPEGRVTTYGALAHAAGGTPITARSITAILSKAPNKRAIPFHRIVYSNKKVWFAPNQEKDRRALYKREGINVDTNGTIRNFDDIYYDEWDN
jgi:alkylated DNA nucleotide flippase Atl1